MAPAKEVAQVAAAIGRTFSRTVLCRVHGGDEQTIADALSKLIDADLIVLPGGIGEESSCRFRHALVQEAAYQSMLRTSRVKWHGRIAKVLEHDFPETTEREPELLAHHFMLAGGLRQAEMYWLAAARMAMTRSANLEAIEHLSRALECLHQAPVSEDRDRREMDLQIMIAVPLAFVNGYAHQKVRAAYTRARELCRQYGETELLFKVVYGQFRSSLVGGEYAAALESAEFLASIMDEFDDPVLSAAIHRSRGAVLTYLGRPGEALQHLNMGIGIELKMADRNRGLNFDVVDLPVALHAYSAWNNWLCGNSGGAKQAITKALDYAGETEHPFTVSFSLAFASWIYQFLGDEEAVRKTSARLMALSEENAFHFWLGWGRVMNGWARRAELGEKALAMMEQGMEEWRGTASRLGLSYFLYLYADAALSLAQVAKARDVLAEAQAFEVESGEAFWKPELIRLAGEIARAQGDHVACEALLHQAVTTAREMGMRGLQLRAAKSAAHAAKEGRGFVWADAALREALEGMPKDERK